MNGTVVEGLRYGPLPAHVGDLYLPSRDSVPTALVVNVHGGAWMTGDRSMCNEWALELVGRGIPIANMNYRINPDPIGPMIEDVWSMLAWAHKRFPGCSVVLTGDSAGAHLCLLGWLSRQGGGPHESPGPSAPLASVAGMVLYSGPLDLDELLEDGKYSERFAGYRATLLAGRAGRGGDAWWDAINPARRVSEVTVPILAFTSASDFFHDSTVQFVKQASAAGAAVTLVDFGSDHPACKHSWQLDPTLIESQETYLLTADFVRACAD